MKIKLELEMDEKTAKLFLQSAIERVINTSCNMVEKSPDENRDINLEDWDEWKPIVCALWSGVHDKVYRQLAGMEDDNRVFTLHKGN